MKEIQDNLGLKLELGYSLTEWTLQLDVQMRSILKEHTAILWMFLMCLFSLRTETTKGPKDESGYEYSRDYGLV